MIERNNRLHTRYGKIQFENKLTGENRIYDAIIIKIVNEDDGQRPITIGHMSY